MSFIGLPAIDSCFWMSASTEAGRTELIVRAKLSMLGLSTRSAKGRSRSTSSSSRATARLRKSWMRVSMLTRRERAEEGKDERHDRAEDGNRQRVR